MIEMVRYAVVAVTMILAHSVADHLVQTHWQAMTKGQCDEHGKATRVGLVALSRHVGTLTLTIAGALAVVILRSPDLQWNLSAVIVGLVFNGLSHAWADHRPNLRSLAYRFGKQQYYDMPGGAGAYAIDQAWHMGWIFISALIVAA